LEITNSIEKIGTKEWIIILISILIITDITILLDIPFLRQIFGFIFLSILPGVLILQILKLNKIGSTEKIVLAVGLSISFLMFFGLLLNNLSLSLGYETPLATIPLLVAFNIVLIVLAAIGYKVNKEPFLSLPNPNLSTSEKAFLIIPVLFPTLSILGMHVMNTRDSNIILMLLLFLIPIYVVFVSFFNKKFPNRIYPVVIFSISISLVLLMSLRSNHILGADTHAEYYLFQTALNDLHWSVFGHSSLDACLSISLLPTIYQSILNMPSEFLSKILCSLIFSISPLIIYVISKKYVGELYGFIASCFFMFQMNFLWTAIYSRANVATLFFALAMMTLFNDRIGPLKKRILFIMFMASCMVSHYSTTYIFFFIMLGTYIGVEILSKKYTIKEVVSLTIMILFFALIFVWYSQATGTAFNVGVEYIENTLSNLNRFFVEESRGVPTQAIFGKGIVQETIPCQIEWVFTWLTFAFVGIGIITLLIKRKEMSFPELNFKKVEFLKEKFEVEYSVIALACSGLLVIMVALPFISLHYSLHRLYGVAITILSVFFVIGGIMIAKYLNKLFAVLRGKVLRKHFLSKEKNCTKKGCNSFDKPFLSKKRFVLKEKQKKSTKNDSQVLAYVIILLVLIPYFLCISGVMYNIFGVPMEITLNSEGEQYDRLYIHDKEIYGARWLRNNGELENTKIYTDFVGGSRLLSQALIPRYDSYALLMENREIEGYIYLRYYNVVEGKLSSRYEEHNMTEYQDKFVGKSKVYNCGGSEIWR
jgi:uncharacterized membrane protein